MKKIICIILGIMLTFSHSGMTSVASEGEYVNLSEAIDDALNNDAEDDSNEKNSDLEISSKSAILMEAQTGKVIFCKNEDESLRPASVTKIMTLLLIFEEIQRGNMRYDDIVTVTEHAASMGGSQCFFEAGEQQIVEDMIKCIEVASGNDAAVAMAEHIAGSEAAFVEMMNARAKELGMENTHFENACGLEAEGHVTSAKDIAIMSRELIVNHPEIFNYSTIWMDSIIHKTKKGESQFDLANTNKFLKQYTGATGLKTGYTSQAKYCISATAKRNDIELIAVIMGAETKEIRNSEIARMLDYGFAKCEIYTDSQVVPGNQKFKVSMGVKEYVDFDVENTNKITLLEGNVEEIKKELVIYENLEAPIHLGDIIGVVQYTYKGQLIDEVYVYAAEDVKKKSYGHSIKDLMKKIFMM